MCSHVTGLTEFRFKRMYRMSFDQYQALFDLIQPFLVKKTQMARVSDPVAPVLMLAMTLRSVRPMSLTVL